MSGIRILSREVKVQAEDVRISRQATQITLNEYKAGTQAFTAVVTAETQQLRAEESLLSTQGQLQTDAVNLIVALAQPLFNGGLTTAQVEAARQTYDADVAIYRETVLTAIQQVEDALSGIRILSREVKVQAEDVRISREATQITLNEYKAGTQAFTAVVTAETQQLGAEESLLSTQGQLQADAVDLIVALGGGWSQSILPDVMAQTSAIPPH